MHFLEPLAFFFAFTIPVVVVFYLLKRKRVVRLVSSTLLWQKFLAETQASAPFQKLRRNWLLILQILLLLLAVLALSRPYFPTKAKNSDLRVIILDASASMQATDESPSRFEKARKEALEWVDSLRENDKMVVLQVAANTEVKQSETSDKAALRRAILSCKALDSPTHLIPALKMAESLVRDRGRDSNPEIHLFSDGAVPDSSVFDNKTLPLIFHRVGTRSDNLGITALDVRANPEDPSQRAIYASIQNFSSNSMDTELELRFDGQLVVPPRALSIKPGEVSPQVFIASQTNDGVFTLRSTLDDDLAADNEASIVSLLPHPVKVLLVTRGNRLLEKALRSTPNVDLTVAPDLANDGAEYDFVALDGVTPTVWPAGNVLAIQAFQTNWFEKVSAVENPAIVDWRPTHPVLYSVSFDNVHVAKSLEVKTPSWGISLVDSQQASLIVGGELGRQRILWLGFDVLESDWPLRVSFPIFIENAVDWLNPATARNRQLLVHAGDPFRLALARPVSAAQITLPDGSTHDLPVGTNATEVVFGDTFKEGTYRLKVGTNETVFCVALLDAAESNIKPRDEIQLGKYTRVSATTLHRTNMELWRTIAAIALGVLLFEWWYYHRRTV
jgi:Ca-activated chloride channel homolog